MTAVRYLIFDSEVILHQLRRDSAEEQGDCDSVIRAFNNVNIKMRKNTEALGKKKRH